MSASRALVRDALTADRPGRARAWGVRVICLSAGLLAAAVCGAAPGKPARRKTAARPATARVSFRRDVLPILRRSCTSGTGCHARATAAAGQRFDTSDPYPALVNARSSLAPMRMRVKPGNPDESVLWLKVTGKHQQARIFGDRMPPKKPLPPADLRAIERWIRQGAPR